MDTNNTSSANSLTYKLKYPLIQGNGAIEVTELTFRQLKMKQQKKLAGIKDDMERVYMLIELCCNIDPTLIDEIDLREMNDIQEKIAAFLPQSPATN